MNYILKEPVCPCGSCEFTQHCQEQVLGGDNKRWTTKAERDADPTLVISPWQQTVAIPDETWNTCAKCDKLLSAQAIAALLEKLKCDPREFRVTEIIGVAFGNVAGIQNSDIVS